MRPSWKLWRHTMFALLFANMAMLFNSSIAFTQTTNRGANASLSATRQTRTDEFGSITGFAFDSLLMKPIVNAVIQLIGANRTATTDERGKFHFNRITAGTYQVAMSTPALDTLGFGTLGTDVNVAPRVSSTVFIAPPSLRTLWARNCMATNTIGRDSGIVWGTIRDARSHTVVPEAATTFHWYDLKPGKAVGLAIREVDAQAATNSGGVYFACGLPSDVAIGSEGITSNSASGRIEYALNARRVHRLDLVVSDEMVTTVHADSSVNSSATTSGISTSNVVINADGSAAMRGSSTLRGVVLSDKQRPLANALISIANIDTVVRTDENGRFQLASLPAGTHALTVRRVGQPPTMQSIDLHPEEVSDVAISMSSAATLTTVKVRAEKTMSRERLDFEQRKKSAFVRVREGEIFDKRADMYSVLDNMPELVMTRDGFGLDIRMRRFGRKGCVPEAYLDGFRIDVQTASSLPVDMYRAVEVYKNPQAVPAEYTSRNTINCGAMLFWTKRIKW